MKKWKTLKTEVLFESQFAKFRRESCELGDGRVMPSYYILDLKDWVNVVALTQEGKVILVRQYRHAAQQVTLEIPGGAIDRADLSPEVAARRELLEETGYEAGELLYSTFHLPNPALQTNKMWTCVFDSCIKKADPQWDEFEEIEVDIVSKEELNELVLSNQINHSLILASLFIAWPIINSKK